MPSRDARFSARVCSGPEQFVHRGLASDRVEVRVPARHLAAAVPQVDRLAEVLDGAVRLAREALAARHVVEEVRLARMGLEQLAALARRLGVLADRGPTPEAFTFKQRFPAPA